jgi:hypothetical protein
MPSLPIFIPFADGSSLCAGNDTLPGYRTFLALLKIPVAEMERQAAQSKSPIVLARTCSNGWVALHHGLTPHSENGWSWLIADRPDSLASKEALAAFGRLRAESLEAGIPLEGFSE